MDRLPRLREVRPARRAGAAQGEVAADPGASLVRHPPPPPYPGPPFPTSQGDLPRRCLKASISERGCCPVCGAQWARVVEKGIITDRNTIKNNMTGQDFMQGWAGY